ncbi:MAG TPA: FG-GAP-like repeat-containing protein [Planctomycetota bacterium]|jgi:hypothetical protein|nr:FG-GAP-like repeat-containing protein [Planctomycetota bacterium]
MRRNRILTIGLFTVAATLVAHSDVALGQEAASAQAAQTLRAFEARHGAGWAVEWNRKTGVVRSLFGAGALLAEPGPATAEEALALASGLILENAEMFGIRPGELGQGQAFPTGRHWYVHFPQRYRGLEVEGGRVRVQLTGGALAFAGSDAMPGIDLPVEPRVSGEEAVVLAKAGTGFEEGRDRVLDSTLLVFPVEEASRFEAHLAWRVSLAVEAPFTRPSVYVDALDRAILAVRENLISNDFPGHVEGYVNVPDPSGHTLPYQGPSSVALANLPDMRVRSILAGNWNGEVANDQFGSSVSGAGDVDGDGHADLVVGAPYHPGGTNSGTAYVYSGNTGALLFASNGDALGSFGYSVSGAGDVDGDGLADVVVGAPYYIGPVGIFSGKAYLYSGSTGALLFAWDGEDQYNLFGISVSGAGDVDGDGLADVVVGARDHIGPGLGYTRGKAYLYSGSTGALLFAWDAEAGYNRFGCSVSRAGDVDGDGHADVVVGAFGDGASSGKAYVYSGNTGALLFASNGEAAGDHFGNSVSGAGDVDGDGHADVVVGADLHAGPGGGSSGKAYVYSGNTGALLFASNGEAAGDHFGYSVSRAGDVDGNGLADVVVGAPTHDSLGGVDTGKAYVYSGSTGALLLASSGEVANDRLGSSVAGAGDVDGDGLADVVVGAPYHAGPAGTNSGKAYVSGALATTDLSGNFTFSSTAPQVPVTIALEGPWVRVLDQNGGGTPNNLSLAATLVPNLTPFTFNTQQQESTTAQANAAFYVNKIHGYLKGILPAATDLDIPIVTNVNNPSVDLNGDGIPDPCNAFFSSSPGDLGLTFMNASVGVCANAAYGTVVYHEYGHFLDNVLNGIGPGSGGSALSEGIGDLVALYATGQPIIGEQFRASPSASCPPVPPATWIRNYGVPVPCGSADRKWPALACADEPHCVGETFGGFAWDARSNLVASLGAAIGIPEAEAAALGALPANDVTIPDTVRRVFLTDDDDGILWNGTPHFADLFTAACNHGFASDVIFGLPALLAASPATVSAAAGGTITLQLDACSNLAGRIYAIGLSGTGTQPGIPLFGLTVPLVFDIFTLIGSLNLNSAYLRNTLGTLDAQGRASAQIIAPPGVFQPGMQLYFAAVILPGLSSLPAASVNATVTFL